jgi:hypothetical protein
MKASKKQSELELHLVGGAAKLDSDGTQVISSPLRDGNDLEYVSIKPVKGLAASFSRLDSPRKIGEFAAEYGLLHVSIPKNPLVAEFFWPPTPRYPLPRDHRRAGSTESLVLWEEYASAMRELLGVYNILKRGKTNPSFDMEGRLLDVFAIEQEEDTSRLCSVVWRKNGGFTGVFLDTERDTSLPATAALVLASVTARMIEGGVYLTHKALSSAEDSLFGYRVIEKHCTVSPLAAAFYDLWEMITEQRPIITCEYCGRVIEKSGRRKYCDNLCRQAAYERRKKALPDSPEPHPKPDCI